MNVKVAPFPSELFSAHILPPWASMMLFDMNRPRPVPTKDFEANFEKSLGIISWSIPIPVSFMETITLSLSFLWVEIIILPVDYTTLSISSLRSYYIHSGGRSSSTLVIISIFWALYNDIGMKIDWWKYISNSDHKIITDYELLEILKQIVRAYNIIQLNKQEPIIIKDSSNNNNNNNCQQIF